MNKGRTNIFIPAAGFGKRMNQLTTGIPKPLLPVGGYPMIDYALYLAWLWQADRIFINAHYLAEQIERYFFFLKTRKCQVCTEHIQILGTAGGIKTCTANQLTDEDLLIVINPDLLLFPSLNFLPIPENFSGEILLYLAERKEGDDYTPLELENGNVTFGDGKFFFTGLSVIRVSALRKVEPGKYHDLAELFKIFSDQGQLYGTLFPGKILDLGDEKRYLALKDSNITSNLDKLLWEKFRAEFFPVS